MISALVVPTWAAVLTLLAVLALGVAVALLLAAVRRSRRRTEELITAAAADAEELRSQLAAIEDRLSPPRASVTVVDDHEYVITGFKGPREDGLRPAAPMLPPGQFADVLLRESVIKTTALAAGLRRALSPEVRHRIRFEMKREVKRARKQRRVDLRQAKREWQARQRAGIDVEAAP